jgi:DNA recombination protein RmuC
MLSEPSVYLLAGLAVLNAGLILWLLRVAQAQPDAATGVAAGMAGRFDAIDRNAEALRRSLTEMDQALRGAIAIGISGGLERAFDKVQEATKAQAEQLGELAERMRSGFDGFSGRLREEQEQLREKVEGKLNEIRTGNEAKLEQMRKAVDEQLQSALEKRLLESFQQVTEQFAQVQQAIGQVKDVAGQIGDLKRLFSNVKVRGGIGEDHLGVLLDDFLPPGSYEKNFRVSGSGEIVEYAVRIPVKGNDGDKWLAIDAKFPTEDYQRLVQANEVNDRDQVNIARKALERKIRDEAKRISGKYIRPPQTLEYAIMYLPSDGLDSVVSNIPGLLDALRRQYAVHVMGPRVLPAHLHCIRVGYLTLALEQKAGAIGEVLAAVKAEWSKLGDSLDTLARRAKSLNEGIRQTQQRTRVVGRTLKTVDALEFDRAEEVLGLSDEALVIEADAEADGSEIPVLAPNRPRARRDPEAADVTEIPF